VSDLKDKRWRDLCEAASREHDPEKLLELIAVLNNVLEQMAEGEQANRGRAVAREDSSGRRTISIVAA
jgi:hypothetical protein